LAEIAAGIALTLSEVVTALVGWVVAKLRGHDLFDEVMGEAEAGLLGHPHPSPPPPSRKRSGSALLELPYATSS
jgi:hypothetical protein